MARPEDITFATEDVTVYLAAAGAGKTSALMDEMAGLLAEYRPDEIAFVTFTRKGVQNGIERALLANPGLSRDDLVHFRTLHALCFRELGLKHASIITKKDMRDFNALHGFKVYLSEAFENQTADDRMLARYDALRSGGARTSLVYNADMAGVHYNRLVKAYEKFKADKGLVDFCDCLSLFKERGEPVAGVKAAFIDEAQDLTPLQWEVCRTAFSACEKIRVAGDDFQSLFTYAGASPKTLVSLSRRYKTVKLETSYRIPKAVYGYAKGLTAMLTDKIEKDFRPSKDYEGFVEDVKDTNRLMLKIRRDFSSNGYTPCRWYLLFRNNCYIERYAEMLEQQLIPYHTVKGFCIPETELADIRRYYNYRKQGYGSEDARAAFMKKHGIKDFNEDFAESELIPSRKRYAYSAYVEKYGVDSLMEMSRKEPCVLLSTTHRVKGGEADYVAVFLDCTGQVYNNKIFNVDEELRVLYVACTRARLGLYLVASENGRGLDDIAALAKEVA